jgi:DsbC/DsbD-like thiol-disulfide interchange protein
VQFPAPERYTAQGSYTGYGYKDETAVFVEVRAKANLGSNDVSRFDLDASWVACKRECATERTSAFVELPTTYGPAPAADVAKSVEPFLARIPKPFFDEAKAEKRWDEGQRDATFVVKLPGATLKDFISDGSGDPAPSKTSFADDEAHFVFEAAPKPGSRPLRGVLVASAAGKDEFYDLEAPLPGSEQAVAKAGPVTKKRGSR